MIFGLSLSGSLLFLLLILLVQQEVHMAGIFNCDWLSFTADFTRYNAFGAEGTARDQFDPDSNKHLRTLMTKLDEQREKTDGLGYIDLGLFKFQVMNHGNRSYYYILHNEDLEIRLARWRSKDERIFPVYVHFKSQFLWSEIYSVTSLMDKFLLVIEWLEDVLNGKYIASKINRIDLCYHTDDVPEDFNVDQFVGSFTLDTVRRTHRVISGIDLGSRKSQKIFLRCYNKFLEVRATKKLWFYEIWQHANLNIRKVWNIEFQMNRDFFSEARMRAFKLDSAEQVIEAMPAIWTYLTNDWVSYRVPDNERRSRWSFHPWWLSLSNFHECKDKISRGRQRELPTTDVLVPALRGYLTSYQARTGVDLNDGSLFQRLFQDLADYDERMGREFADTVKMKQELIDPEFSLDSLDGRINDLVDREERLWKQYRSRETDIKPDLLLSVSENEKRDVAASLLS